MKVMVEMVVVVVVVVALMPSHHSNRSATADTSSVLVPQTDVQLVLSH